MGCHTWFYKPTVKTTEEIKELVLSYIESEIDLFSNPDYKARLLDHYSGIYTPQSIEYNLKFYSKWLLRIKSKRPIWFAAIYSDVFHYKFGCLTKYYKGILYEESEQHDIFRVHDYPNDKLLSFNDVVNFCKKRGIDLPQHDCDKIAQWFLTAPEGGLIKFG